MMIGVAAWFRYGQFTWGSGLGTCLLIPLLPLTLSIRSRKDLRRKSKRWQDGEITFDLDDTLPHTEAKRG
ncbi:MAG: hypothetical protein RL095_2840 [Verrucomicrobiota bacterium]